MAVLIVTKTTNYELHGSVVEAKVEQGRMGADVLERLRSAHTEHYQTLTRLREALKRAGTPFDEVSRHAADPWSRTYDAVVTVGGDGTLLAASHHMGRGGVVFGVRSSTSSVGFLCCAGPDGVDKVVDALRKGVWQCDEVHRVTADVTRVDSGVIEPTMPVLNDFLYTNANPAATTRYKLTVKDKVETHRSSGIWVATGVGSTAAILAAGGERRPRHDALIQYRVRELYRLGNEVPTLAGGLLDLDKEPLVVENRCVQALLALDGQHGVVELAYGDTVTFRRAATLKLVRKL
jgi:NAD+ kinase